MTSLQPTNVFQEATFDSLSYIVFVADPLGIIQSFNKTAENLLGYNANDLIGKARIDIIFDPTELSNYAQSISKALGTELQVFDALITKAILSGVDEREWLYVCQSGKRIPVKLSIIALRNEDSETTGFIGIARDISEEKWLEKVAKLRVDISTSITTNSSLKECLQECAEAIAKYLDITFVRIWIVNKEEKTLELQANVGLYTYIDEQDSQILIGKNKIGIIAKERKAILTNDIINDDDITDKEWAKRYSIVAFAGYPLIVENEVVGVLSLLSQRQLNTNVLNALAVVVDIIAYNIERKYAEEILRYSQIRLELINNINNGIIIGLSADQIIEDTILQLYKYFPKFCVAYSIVKESTLNVLYSLEPKAMTVSKGLIIDLSSVPNYLIALQTGQPIAINDLRKESLLEPLSEIITNSGVKSVLGIPIKYSEAIFGILFLGSPEARKWSKQEILLLKEIANCLTVTIKEAQAQQDRREIERFFSMSEDIFCICSKDGYFKRINPVAEKLLGYSLDELYKKSFLEFIHPDDKEKTLSLMERGFRGEKIEEKEFENRYLCKDGTYKCISWGGIVLTEESLFYAVGRNVTEKKKLDDELVKLSLVASKTDNGVMILNKRGLIDWVNEAFVILSGYSQEEIIGNTPEIILQGKVGGSLSNPIRTSAIRKSFNEKIQCSKKGGQPYWISTSITPIFGNYGEIKQYIVIATDVTKGHLIENRILANEARLAGIIDFAMDAIITFDINQRILFFNHRAEEFFICPASKAIGQLISTFIPKWDSEDLATSYAVCSNGEEFPIEATKSEIIVTGEKLYTIILRDITERQLAEEKLKEYAANLENINKELDQFAYVVSHDLKAPLRAISHLSEWLEEDIADLINDENRRNLALLRGRVQRMEDLINGILQYSKIGRSQIPLELVDTTILIQEIIADLDLSTTFSFDIQPNMPILFTAKILLKQVFTNLISNSIKYHNCNDGNIKIGVKEKEDFFYEFFVADDGPGIDARYHTKIFVIFQTLESRDKVESTGVGLAIVKKIVESQGGKVWLESEVGKGSTFYFTWLDVVAKQRTSSSRLTTKLQRVQNLEL